MLKKTRFLHFVLGLISLIIIFFVIDYIYYSYYPSTFAPNIKEMTQLPPDVKEMEDLLNSNSISESTNGASLLNNMIKSSKPKIPNHFRIPILVYHYVEYVKDRGDKIRISLNIQPNIFESQIKTLKQAGYTFMMPKQIPDLFSGKISVPAKPIILSFDDGYKDFYTDVFPILKNII